MEMNMINELMRSTTIVLQDIEVIGTGCYGDFLCDGQKLSQILIRNIREFCAVEFGDDKSVSSTQWLDVEECKDLVTLEEFEGWDVTLDDFAEDAGRGSHLECLNRLDVGLI
jgi:hypothetical protein